MADLSVRLILGCVFGKLSIYSFFGCVLVSVSAIRSTAEVKSAGKLLGKAKHARETTKKKLQKEKFLLLMNVSTGNARMIKAEPSPLPAPFMQCGRR